jgi:ABC-type uncharacterized transport system permease subunit
MFGEYTFWYVLINFVIMLFGVVAHFAKKKIKGETLADIKTYFKTHFKETTVTVIAGIVAFGSLVATGGLGIIASFTVGYAADSIFNKSAK